MLAHIIFGEVWTLDILVNLGILIGNPLVNDLLTPLNTTVGTPESNTIETIISISLPRTNELILDNTDELLVCTGLRVDSLARTTPKKSETIPVRENPVTIEIDGLRCINNIGIVTRVGIEIADAIETKVRIVVTIGLLTRIGDEAPVADIPLLIDLLIGSTVSYICSTTNLLAGGTLCTKPGVLDSTIDTPGLAHASSLQAG
jgi:hypothetical protein